MRRAALGLALALAAHAWAGPQPPCGAAQALPPYAAPEAPPNVVTWTGEAARWTPPACLPWPSGEYRMLVALAGSFRHAGNADALRARLGAISARQGLRYWSVTDKTWRVLITDAAALEGKRRRADYSAAELKPGTVLLYEEQDNRAPQPIVYRMRVLEANDERIVVTTENVSAVRAFMATLFPPGSLRAAIFLERRAAGTWGFYGISATTGEASAFAAMSEDSYVNRATALYRHFIEQGARQ